MSTKNKKSNCDKTLKLKLWQSSTTRVFKRLINFNWKKTEEKKKRFKKKKKIKVDNTKKKVNWKKRTEK